MDKMPEDRGVEPPEGADGGYVGILDVAVIGGLVVVLLILALRFRRRRLEEKKSLRKLSVVK